MRAFPLALIAAGVVAAGSAVAADWPQFRGPGGAGIADKAVPVAWGKTKNIAWAKDIPGLGWASPVVAGGRVYLLTADAEKQTKPSGGFGNAYPTDAASTPLPPDVQAPPGFGGMKQPNYDLKWQVLCLDAATGETLWTTTVAEKKPAISTFPSNGYASETPVADGDKVYAYAAAAGLFCLDKAGKVVWKTDLGTYPTSLGFGTGSSPVLLGDKIFVLYDNEVKSFLVAVDKATGKELWKVDRPGKSAWSSPFVWKAKGRTELVCCGEKSVTSYDPETGKELWQFGGVENGFMNTPVADADMLYFGNSSQGGQGPIWAVKAGASGDITLAKDQTSSEAVAWSRPKAGPGISSMLLYDGYLYVAGPQGMLSCYEAKTGNPAYTKERLPKGRGTTASPWAADGKIYILDDTGRTTVVGAGPKFEVLGDNAIEEMCWATPAAADGKLYIRGRDKLYCITEKH